MHAHFYNFYLKCCFGMKVYWLLKYKRTQICLCDATKNYEKKDNDQCIDHHKYLKFL